MPGLVIASGDLIEGDASTTNEVDYTISGLITTTLNTIADGQLADAKGTLYTAGATITIISITLVNTGAAARTVNLYLKPGATSRRIIPKDVSLGAGYSLHTDGTSFQVVDTNGQIMTASAVSAHAINHTDGTDDIQDTSTSQKGIVQLDDTAGGTDSEVVKPPTSNAFYDHVQDTSTHGVTVVGDVTGPASSTDNEIARQHSTSGKILQTYTSNPPTVSDTGDMNIDGDLDVENIVVSGNVDGVDVSARDHAEAHNAEHENTGGDEISVADLSGLLADDQHVLDTEVESVITAEIVGGQSIDNAIDSLVGTHATTKSANATLGHVIVETASKIDVDGDGKLTLGSDVLLEADLEGAPTEDEAAKAPTSEYAFDHNAKAATDAVQGHATAAQITKLDGITALADVTSENTCDTPYVAHGSDHTNGTDDVPDLVGANGAGGTHGLVPAPSANDAAAGKFLKADATWDTPAGGGASTLVDLTDTPANYTNEKNKVLMVNDGETAMELVTVVRFATKAYAATNGDATEKRQCDYLMTGNVANDTTQINNDLTSGHFIQFLSGRFTFGNITAAVSNASMRGLPGKTELYLGDGQDSHLITLGGDGWFIADMKLNGNSANNAGDLMAILNNGKDNCLYENLEVTDFRKWALGFVAGATKNRITGLWAHENLRYAIYGYDAGTLLINSSRFRGNNAGGTFGDIQIDGATATIGWNIDNCDFDAGADPSYPAVYVAQGFGINLTNSRTTGVGGNSILRVAGTSAFVSMTNCSCYNLWHNCVLITNNANHVTLTGNTFYLSEFSSVYIEEADGVPHHITLGHNTYKNSGTTGSRIAIEVVGGTPHHITIDGEIMEEDRGTPYMTWCIKFGGIKSIITACHLKGAVAGGIWLPAGQVCDDLSIYGNFFDDMPTGVFGEDGNDLLLALNKYRNCTTPIDISAAAMVRTKLINEDWNGCTNDPDITGATTPQIQGCFDKNGDSYQSNQLGSVSLEGALGGDGTYKGIVEPGIAGATLAFGEPVYKAGTGKWLLTKADAAATSAGEIGMVVLAAAGDTDPTIILKYGKIRSATYPAFTVGGKVHLSAATAGDVVVAAPSGTEDFVVRIIGYGSTAEDLFVDSNTTYIELEAP